MARGKKQATPVTSDANGMTNMAGAQGTGQPKGKPTPQPANAAGQAAEAAESQPKGKPSSGKGGGKAALASNASAATNAGMPPVQGKKGDYCRWRSKARTTGAMIGVYDLDVTPVPEVAIGDAVVAAAKVAKHRFAVRCEDHGSTTTVPKLTDAWEALARPTFCTACKAGKP
jgi:hypothetical protein